jgi:hypothetical protein
MKELFFENKKRNGCNEIFSVIRRDVFYETEVA